MDPKETSLYYLYLVTLLVIVSLVLFYLISALRMRARFRRVSDEQLAAEINKLESEKTRISQDLHDEIGPILTAIKMHLELLNPTTDKENTALEKSRNQIDILTNKIRSISITLMPSVLQDKGLAIAIQQYIHNLQGEGRPVIKYSFESIPMLTLSHSLHLFRIVQEIIHNTIKHAKATKLSIHLTEENNNIILATADDGQGFDFEKSILAHHGYGLGNMQNRVQSLSGYMNVKSSPENGTQYFIEVPISEQKNSV